MGIIYTENLVKTFGVGQSEVRAIDGISLNINRGFHAITGPSGSGKSTLLQLIGGLRIPDKGRVQMKNTDLSIFDDEELAIFRRRNVGFIFRQYNLIPVLNVYENITFPLELDGRSNDKEYIHQITRLLGLEDKLTKFPKTLSSGERQKVSIARALSTKPAVILADEPTGNLDTRAALEVVGLLKMTCREFDQTIIMVTHDKEMAEMADRIIYLRDGKVEKESKGGKYEE